MRRLPIAAGLILALLMATGAAAQPIRSVYTEISATECREIRAAGPEDGAFADHRCPGALGWGVILNEDDARASLTLIAPNARVNDLALWEVIGGGFSSVGPRAEWRVRGRGIEPHGFIVRYVLSEGGSPAVSWLVVAQLSGDGACAVRRVAPGPRQNQIAREIADGPPRPCLEPEV